MIQLFGLGAATSRFLRPTQVGCGAERCGPASLAVPQEPPGELIAELRVLCWRVSCRRRERRAEAWQGAIALAPEVLPYLAERLAYGSRAE